MPIDPNRDFLRHVLATIAYRGAKSLRGAPAGFGELRAGDPAVGSRSAVEILAHLGDLLNWTARLVAGGQDWRSAWQSQPPGSWDEEVARFYEGLRRADTALASESTPSLTLEQIFQGPIADALTHVGQLGLLRRLAGAPVRGEVMILSDVTPGRLGPEQSPPVREFGER
jgi:hypothetical protein